MPSHESECHPPVDVERLKDIAQNFGYCRVEATVRTSPDSWETVVVRHASIWEDAPDGWTVEIRETSL